MILLDTNILSALMQHTADQAVVQWLDGVEPSEVWTTSITIFEIRFGLARRGASRETARLQAAFDALIAEDLEGRVAPMDTAAAGAAAQLAAQRTATGYIVDIRDTLIAGIAIARNAKLVTRNLRHFADLPIPAIDPWAKFP